MAVGTTTLYRIYITVSVLASLYTAYILYRLISVWFTDKIGNVKWSQVSLDAVPSGVWLDTLHFVLLLVMVFGFLGAWDTGMEWRMAWEEEQCNAFLKDKLEGTSPDAVNPLNESVIPPTEDNGGGVVGADNP